MEQEEIIDVIDEDDNVIGQEYRTAVHRKGLLHREVHCWFYNSDKILFQKRSATKETFPSKLDATIGGHVPAGHSYMETVVIEVEEETGIKLTEDKLSFIEKTRTKSVDDQNQLINNVVRSTFAYKFLGKAASIRIEEGQAEGFEWWEIKNIENLTTEQENLFVPFEWEKLLKLFSKFK